MSGKRGGVRAADVAKLPPSEWPDWYKPPGGERPQPYQAGNVERLTTGYRSPRVYNRVAQALIQGLVESRPDLRAFPESLASWSDAEARAALIRYRLDTDGTFDDNGEVRQSLLVMLERFERRASAERGKLGLDPRSEAELSLLRGKALREGIGHRALSLDSELDRLASIGMEALERGSGRDDNPAHLIESVLAEVRAEAAGADLSASQPDPRPVPANGVETPTTGHTDPKTQQRGNHD
ncbi:MAG: hypothetical protein WAS54_06065 [Scrofimicrobium sp.]